MLSYYGICERLVHDNGREFCSEVISKVLKLWGVSECKSSSYHPQAMGKVERQNSIICEKLRILIEETGEEWDELLPQVQLAMNSVINRSTGYSHFYLMHLRP